MSSSTHTHPPKTLITMGLQHVFIMFGTTILLPVLTGLEVSVTLFAVGVGTLLFHAITRGKIPAFLGSSFAFLAPIIAIGYTQGTAYALGGILVAGLVYLVIAGLLACVKPDMILHYIPSHVSATIIVLIGLVLAPIAIENAQQHRPIALVTAVIVLSVKLYGHKIYRGLPLFPVLIGMAGGYVFAGLYGHIDLSAVAQASRIGIPNFSLPKFSLSAILMMVPIAIVTIAEHTGDMIAIGRVVGKDFVKDPGLKYTLLGNGIATIFSALIGGPASTTYSENTGAVALTKVFDPIVMRIAAVTAILLAFIPKFTAIIITIPSAVIGGISIILFGMIASIGVKSFVDNAVDFSDIRVSTTVGTMLIVSVGGAVMQYGNIHVSGLGLAVLIGIFLNFVFTKTLSCGSSPENIEK